MIELFTAPKGWQASIMLEECELPYALRTVDPAKGEPLAAAPR